MSKTISGRLLQLQKSTFELNHKLNQHRLETPDALSGIVRILSGITIYLQELEQKKLNT